MGLKSDNFSRYKVRRQILNCVERLRDLKSGVSYMNTTNLILISFGKSLKTEIFKMLVFLKCLLKHGTQCQLAV